MLDTVVSVVVLGVFLAGLLWVAYRVGPQDPQDPRKWL